nr:hypothetical protein [Tanacetum cinerariifolium]
MSWFSRCSWCGGPFNSENYRHCTNVSFGDEPVYDSNPNSYNPTPDFSNPLPHHNYETDPSIVGAKNEFVHDPNPLSYNNTPDFYDQPPQHHDSNLDEPVLLVTPLFDSNEDECFDPGGDVDEINAFDIPLDSKDGYYDSEGDVLYLESLLSDDTTPNLHPEVDSHFLLPSGSEDTIFDPGISAFHFSSLEPVDCLDYEDSHARGFVQRLLELQSLACLYIGI